MKNFLFLMLQSTHHNAVQSVFSRHTNLAEEKKVSKEKERTKEMEKHI